MRKLAVVVLLLCLCSVRSTCRLVSKVELCYRPQDVLSTRCVYDGANDTFLRFVPSETACTPLDYPNDAGIVYTRLQWTAGCGWCPKGE